ncbi:MAG TPA: hypothetical protein VJ860_24365 [Polyangia bacterium]|nr:hypothetical protein [Polyangia bacterium]
MRSSNRISRHRAVTRVGFILWPLPHPYALALALSALARKELTGHARRQARVAAVVSLLALVVFLVLLLSLLRLLNRPGGLPASQ